MAPLLQGPPVPNVAAEPAVSAQSAPLAQPTQPAQPQPIPQPTQPAQPTLKHLEIQPRRRPLEPEDDDGDDDDDEEDMYDATPRNSIQRRRPEEDSKSRASVLMTPPSPIEGEGGGHRRLAAAVPGLVLDTSSATDAATSNGSRLVARQPTIRATSAEQFEEHKRKVLLREQEEKIPVNPTEPDDLPAAANAHATHTGDEEDLPQMSATSYPGQEWNPYGSFSYEDEE